MSFQKTLQLNNDKTIPQIGLGTWLSKPHEVENSVSQCMRIYAETLSFMRRGTGGMGSRSWISSH
jgi:hypothetical protein